MLRFSDFFSLADDLRFFSFNKAYAAFVRIIKNYLTGGFKLDFMCSCCQLCQLSSKRRPKKLLETVKDCFRTN